MKYFEFFVNCITLRKIRGATEVTPLSVIECDHVTVSHEMDSNLNVSPKMSYGVLGCDIVTLQNYMLMIL